MPKKNQIPAAQRAMKKTSERFINFPKNFFPKPSLETFNQQQKKEYYELIHYLKILSTTAFHYRPSFCKEVIVYDKFPLGDGKLIEVYQALNRYLDLVSNQNEGNQELAKSFGVELYKENIRIFNAFYYGFLKYIKQYELGESSSVAENELASQLNESIRALTPYCSEEEIAKALGCFLDILRWGKIDEAAQIKNNLSYSLVKKCISDIIEKNTLAECREQNRLSPYLCQNFIYEIVIRETNIENKNKYLFNTRFKIDELKSKFLYKDIDNRIKCINDPQKTHTIMLLGLIQQALNKRNTEDLFYYLYNLFDLLVDAFNEPGDKERVSFDKCYENYNFLMDEIVNNIDNYYLTDDVQSLVCFRIISDAYLKVFPMMQKNMNQLYSAFEAKVGVYRSLSDFQKEQLQDILSSEKFKNDSKYYHISYNIKTNINYLFKPDHPKQEIERKVKHIQNKNSIGFMLANKFNLEVELKYFSVIKSYIRSLIPEDLVNDLYKENGIERSVIFCIRKNKVSSLLKKHKKILQPVDDGVLLDLSSVIMTDEDLRDILMQIVNNYRSQLDERKAYQEVVFFYERQKEKNLTENFSRLTVDSNKTKDTPEEKDRLVEVLPEENYNKNLFDPSPNLIKSKIMKHSKLEVSEKKERKVLINNEMLKRAQVEQKIKIALLEAQKELGDKAAQYILSPIRSSYAMKNILIIAVNKKLKDDESGRPISNEAQDKINNMVKSIDFVISLGKDGIKICDGIFVLKTRSAGGQSYRGFTKEKYLDSGGFLLQYDNLTKKNHSDKKLKIAIKRNKKR